MALHCLALEAVPVDTTGDAMLNAVGLDTTGDGELDRFGVPVDTTGDGLVYVRIITHTTHHASHHISRTRKGLTIIVIVAHGF